MARITRASLERLMRLEAAQQSRGPCVPPQLDLATTREVIKTLWRSGAFYQRDGTGDPTRGTGLAAVRAMLMATLGVTNDDFLPTYADRGDDATWQR